MLVAGAPSEVVVLDLLHAYHRETHPETRLITGVDVIIVMSGSWAGGINVPIVLRNLNLSTL